MQFKHWNRRSVDELRQLLAIASAIEAARGSFVAQADLLNLGRASAVGNSRALRADCRAGGSSDFGRWVLHNLHPSVDRYQLNTKLQTVGVFFYKFPSGPAEMQNIRASFDHCAGKTLAIAVRESLALLDVKSYLSLVPTQASQRIIVAMLGELSQSKSFLECTFGLSPARQKNANASVTAALIVSAKFETIGLQESSKMTVDAALTDFKRRKEAVVAETLTRDHAGGRASLLEACNSIGADLGAIIEDTATLLGKHHYSNGDASGDASGSASGGVSGDSSGDAGGGAGSRRSSALIFRKCTWDALAEGVEIDLREKEKQACNGGVWNTRTGKPITVSATCIRMYCHARLSTSLSGRRHNPVANVGHRKLQAAAGDKAIIDAQSSNARVRNFEQAILSRIRTHGDATIHYADDHSKWEADKKRSFTGKPTILHMNRRQAAPYSDMKNPIPGIKATTSSNLYCMCPDAEQTGTDAVRQKRGECVQKIAVAVQRLLHERPSTALQQLNDHLYAVASHPKLKPFFTDVCLYKLKITDGGADQNPRNDEVKYADTVDHLRSRRIMDIHATRAAGLSPLNEAEHLNGEETSTVTKAEAPSMLAGGVPKNEAELRRNARQFGQALTNAISGGKYGGQRILSLYSHPQLPLTENEKSETIGPDARHAARAIMECSNMEKRNTMPTAAAVVPVLKYFELHSLSGHYSNQLSRFACSRILGRLCKRSDYGHFGLKMHSEAFFVPCNELSELHAAADSQIFGGHFIPDAKKKSDGHYEQYDDVQEAVASGQRAVTYQEPPPSIELKRYFNEDSTIPSIEEIFRLAKDVLNDDTEKGRDDVAAWFADRRLSKLLKQEERRKAAQDAAKDGAVDVEGTVARIVRACATSLPSLRSAAGLSRQCKALLTHIGTVATSGSKDDLVRRVFDMRDYICLKYRLDTADVYPPDISAEESRTCATCGKPGSSTDNPLLVCVAHCENMHHHMTCAKLEHVPPNWLCGPCIDLPVFVIRHIVGKRFQKGRTEYLVGWVGHESEAPSWQAASDVPAGSRYLANAYNLRLRNEALLQPSGGGDVAHVLVGKKVAKDFSHGAVYVGYVTEHYPAQLLHDGVSSTMSEELFHVEYDDGDEEDLDLSEISAAVALAVALG